MPISFSETSYEIRTLVVDIVSIRTDNIFQKYTINIEKVSFVYFYKYWHKNNVLSLCCNAKSVTKHSARVQNKNT